MTHHHLRPRIGVGVVVLRNHQVLMGRRKGAHGAGDWSFAGGHLEFGETVERCAIRELAEETGLQAISISPGPWVNDLIVGDKHYVTLFVFVNEFEGEVQLLEPDTCEGWQWFDCYHLPTPLFSPVQALLEKIGIEGLISMGDPACKSIFKAHQNGTERSNLSCR